MRKKQIKMAVALLELFLIGALFLPAGRIIDSSQKSDSSLSVFGMIARYGGIGFADDALFYTILACTLPIAIILTMLLLHERYNFGTATLLGALQATASACFFSAAAQKLVDYTAMTLLPYLIIFISIAAFLLLVYGFLISQPGGRSDERPE